MFIPTPIDIADQQDRALARLLELGLAAVEKVSARLMAAEDDALVCEQALALNRTSRNVRQTIALQVKVARERRLESQEAAAEVRTADQGRTSHRKSQLKAAIERLIWDEYEYPDGDGEGLVNRLDNHLNDQALRDGFTDQPVEAHIARLCAELGIAPASLAETPPTEREDADDYWRSSA